MVRALAEYPDVIEARQRREAAECALANAIKQDKKARQDLAKYEDMAAMAVCGGKVAQKRNPAQVAM
jgi:hypothetical protein